MATYAPNFTKRLKLSYGSLSANYTQTWRQAEGLETSELIVALNAFYAAIAALLPSNFAFTQAETAAQGEDFFLPASLGSLNTFVGTDDVPLVNLREFRASFLQFQGKTTTGNPWRVNVYTALVAPFNSAAVTSGDDFRIGASDSTAIANAIVALEDAGTVGLVGNDGNPVIIRPYANIGISRYRINRIRRFG